METTRPMLKPEDCVAAPLALVSGGLSITPIRTEGKRAPAVGGWKRCQRDPPDGETIRGWLENERYAIAIIL